MPRINIMVKTDSKVDSFDVENITFEITKLLERRSIETNTIEVNIEGLLLVNKEEKWERES